jgi:hypothetical protein
MFPAYFMLISACTAISVAAFAYLHPWKTASTIERYQLGFLISALGCNLSNLLVFTPMTVEVIYFVHALYLFIYLSLHLPNDTRYYSFGTLYTVNSGLMGTYFLLFISNFEINCTGI